MQEDAESDSLAGVLADLSDASWIRRAEALRTAAARLASEDVDVDDEQRLAQPLVTCATDPKWEVRRAATLALAECRHSDIAQPTLEQLTRDENRWVRKAALQALERIKAARVTNDWPLTEDARDPTLQYIVTRIRAIGLRSLTPAQLYALAMELGEQFYRELAADTAHELRTLLTPFEGYLAELRRHLDTRGHDAVAERYLAEALGRLAHIRQLTDDLREYSSPSDAGFTRVDVGTIVREACAIACAATDDAAKIDQVVDVPDELVVTALRERLVRAVANLVANACQAMPHGGTLSVCARRTDSEDDTVQITIADTGTGMTAEMIEQARMRFRTTRRDAGGTGLGLPIAERIIVHDHGGELLFKSVPGQGTVVTIVLPAQRRSGEA
jgi:signal transduction histidine kinase